MIVRLRRQAGSSLAARAASGLAAYQADTRNPPARAALLGNLQVPHSKKVMIDGPERLAVVTAESICLVDPSPGHIRRATSLIYLAAYLIDPQGRFIVRFDSHDDPSRVAGFRPLAGPDPILSICQAAERFIQAAIDGYQEHTGQPFANTWSPTAVQPIKQWRPEPPAEPNSA